MRRVVYTALFGNYDVLHEHACNDTDCEFICFTDQNHIVSSKWEVKIVRDLSLSPVMTNRKYKIFAHEFLSGYDQSLYIDANILLRGNVDHLFEFYLAEHDMAVPRHYVRDCVFDEAEIVLRSGRIKLWPTLKQMYLYRTDGYQPHHGLGENNIILRRHNERIAQLMSKWWNELNKYEPRDQFSLCYLHWRNPNTKLVYMPENARGVGSEYFVASPHVKRSRSFLIRMYSFLFRYAPFFVFNRIFLKITS